VVTVNYSRRIFMQTLIRSHLDKADLSPSQRIDIATTVGGSYAPSGSELEVLAIDIQILIMEDNTSELIKLYKRLPQPKPDIDCLMNPRESDLGDRAWRLSNLYKIIDKKHQLVTFTMNNAQAHLDELRKLHPRIVNLKSRQRGISTYALIDALDVCLTQSNKIKGLQADTLLASNALMEKVKLAYDKIDDNIKPSIVYANNSEISFDNGSKIRIATSFRGATLSSLHVSELGKIALDPKKASELTAGTFPAIPVNIESSIVLESTSEGAGNLFHSIFTEAMERLSLSDASSSIAHFYPVFIGWLGIIENNLLVPNTADPDCSVEVDMGTLIPRDLEKHLMSLQETLHIELTDEQIEWAVYAYGLLGNDLHEFCREYPATIEDAWKANTEGLILAEAFHAFAKVDKEIREDTRYPLYAASDLGVSDTCATVFYQVINSRILIIDDYFNTGQSIAHYTAIIKQRGVSKWFLPHDANNRNVSTAHKVITHVRLAGFEDYQVLRQTKELWTDISKVRGLMGRITFGNCEPTIKAVQSYRKVWSPQLQEYNDVPLHDDNSNFCDALRYAVIATTKYILKEYK